MVPFHTDYVFHTQNKYHFDLDTVLSNNWTFKIKNHSYSQ